MSDSPGSWVSRVHPVRDGEQVRASVTNRYPDELRQRTDWLKKRLDLVANGEAIYALDVAVSSDVSVGQAIYWDPVAQEYKPAIAKVSYDSESSVYAVSETSFAVGICIFKHTATRADLALSGLLRDIDLTLAIGSVGNTSADAGVYYLSASNAGHFTKQKPAISVFIGVLRGDGVMHINPTPRDLLEGHIHYTYELHARPAGIVDCPTPDQPYTFSLADPAEEGWLPADDSIFNSLAPAGAVYGYNLAAHPELSRVWPPIPAGNAYLEMDGLGVNPARYVVDFNGLWWMDSCYTKAPWPIEPRPCEGDPGSSFSSSSDSSSSGTCDSGSLLEQQGFLRRDPYTAYLRLYFTKMVFKTSNSVVTSLAPAAGSPITLKNCSGEDATTGDLEINVDLGLAVEDTDDSALALKQLDGQIFTRGPIVSGIKPGSNVQASLGSTDLKKAYVDDEGYYHGKIILSATQDNILENGQAELVALNGAREENDSGVFYLGLPAGRDTSFRLRAGMPLSGLGSGATLKFRFMLLAKATAIALPPLKISYMILPRPDGCTPETLPTVDTDLTDLSPDVCGTLNNGQYIEVESESFPVSDGDTIYFQVLREGSTDGYAATVGVLRIGFTVS